MLKLRILKASWMHYTKVRAVTPPEDRYTKNNPSPWGLCFFFPMHNRARYWLRQQHIVYFTHLTLFFFPLSPIPFFYSTTSLFYCSWINNHNPYTLNLFFFCLASLFTLYPSFLPYASSDQLQSNTGLKKQTCL
jgi:hypothetical protein